MEEKLFDKDEYEILSFVKNETRWETINQLEDILPYIKSNKEMTKLICGVIRKLETASDEEYARIN